MDLTSGAMQSFAHYHISNHHSQFYDQPELQNPAVQAQIQATRRSKKPKAVASNIVSSSKKRKCRKKSVKWSQDDEKAFEEAISLIPKYTVKNIPICGVKNGRGRYISMYIRHKTGSIKSAGQIASHLQVLGRAHKGTSLHSMIVYGPGETADICDKFIKVFTAIINSNPAVLEIQDDEYGQDQGSERIPERGENRDRLVQKKGTLKKLEMVFINLKSIGDSHTFSSAPANTLNMEIPGVKYSKPNIEQKFSLLMTISQNENCLKHNSFENLSCPLYIANVGIHRPHNLSSIKGGKFNFQAKLVLPDLTELNAALGIITMVTCEDRIICQYFEQLDCHRNKSKNDIMICLQVGTEFWRKYFSNSSSSKAGTIPSEQYEINKIQIQQLVVSYDRSTTTKKFNISAMKKSDIKYLFQWNFEEINEFLPAYTYINRVVMDNSVSNVNPPHVEEIFIPTDNYELSEFPYMQRKYKSSGDISLAHSRPNYSKSQSLQPLNLDNMPPKMLTPPATAEFPNNNGFFPENETLHRQSDSLQYQDSTTIKLGTNSQLHMQAPLMSNHRVVSDVVSSVNGNQDTTMSLLQQVAQNQALTASQHEQRQQQPFLSDISLSNGEHSTVSHLFKSAEVNHYATSSPIPQVLESKKATPLSSIRFNNSFTQSFEASLYDLDMQHDTNVTEMSSFPAIFNNVTEVEAGPDVDIIAMIDDHIQKEGTVVSRNTTQDYSKKGYEEGIAGLSFPPFENGETAIQNNRDNHSYGYSR